jgi:hypothetical protein
MSDDRRKQGFQLNGGPEIEVEVKASVTNLSAQGFLFDDANPVEVAERPTTMLWAGARRRCAGISGGKDGLGRCHDDGARLGSAAGPC